MPKVLAVIDLQTDFNGFIREAQVLKGVAKLIQSGIYDFIVNVRYIASGKVFPIISDALKNAEKQNIRVVNVIKANDDGSSEILDGLKVNGVNPEISEIHVVGVNTPYCIFSTVEGLIGNEIRNVSVIRKLVSHKEYQRKIVPRSIRQMREMGVAVI